LVKKEASGGDRKLYWTDVVDEKRDEEQMMGIQASTLWDETYTTTMLISLRTAHGIISKLMPQTNSEVELILSSDIPH
jgi:hypothetical protein